MIGPLAAAILVLVSPASVGLARVGLHATSGSTPLYAALDAGCFRDEGLEVETIEIGTGSTSLEALAGDSLDIAPAATLSALQAAERGLDLVIVAPGSFVREDDRVVSGLLVRGDSPISAARDLKGRTIAVNARLGTNYLLTVAYLAAGGVSPDEVVWQEVSFPHMAGALEHGLVDAVSSTQPFLTALTDGGRARVLSSFNEVLPGASLACYVALRSWATTHRREIAAFERAYARGVELTEGDPARVRGILVERTHVDPGLASRVTLHRFRSELSAADIRTLVDLALRYGALEGQPDLDRLLFRSRR